jgi:hypothetical protein
MLTTQTQAYATAFIGCHLGKPLNEPNQGIQNRRCRSKREVSEMPRAARHVFNRLILIRDGQSLLTLKSFHLGPIMLEVKA